MDTQSPRRIFIWIENLDVLTRKITEKTSLMIDRHPHRTYPPTDIKGYLEIHLLHSFEPFREPANNERDMSHRELPYVHSYIPLRKHTYTGQTTAAVCKTPLFMSDSGHHGGLNNYQYHVEIYYLRYLVR